MWATLSFPGAIELLVEVEVGDVTSVELDPDDLLGFRATSGYRTERGKCVCVCVCVCDSISE